MTHERIASAQDCDKLAEEVQAAVVIITDKVPLYCSNVMLKPP